MDKMEIFKKNMEGNGNFSPEFIKYSLNIYKELEEEREVQEMATIEEVIQYYIIAGSFTCNSLKTEENLKEVREDIKVLYNIAGEDVMDLKLYFNNIEKFELQIIHILYYNFYPREEEENL